MCVYDITLWHLEQVCTYMLISCLGYSHPKHSRIYCTIKFREILLDYCSELFTGKLRRNSPQNLCQDLSQNFIPPKRTNERWTRLGIRLSNCRINREWLFSSGVTDMPVVTKSSADSDNPHAERKRDPAKGTHSSFPLTHPKHDNENTIL
jgi:hypothetical protein